MILLHTHICARSFKIIQISESCVLDWGRQRSYTCSQLVLGWENFIQICVGEYYKSKVNMLGDTLSKKRHWPIYNIIEILTFLINNLAILIGSVLESEFELLGFCLWEASEDHLCVGEENPIHGQSCSFDWMFVHFAKTFIFN